MNNKQWSIFINGMILGALYSCAGLNAMDYSQEDVESGIAVKRARIDEDEPTGRVAEQDKDEASRKREWPEEESARVDNEGNQKKIREDEQERVARLFAAAEQGTLCVEDVRPADLYIQDDRGFTLLECAAVNGHRQVVEVLLDRGTYEKGSDSENTLDRALHLAAQAGHRHVVELLLDRGAQIDFADGNGTTALHYAAEAGNREVVELLLGKGAKVDIVDDGGWTALHCAAESGHGEVVDLLLGKGAKVDIVDDGGWTALHCAAESGHGEVVKMLLDRGAQIDAMTKDGINSLHYAAQSGCREVVELLIRKGATIDIVDADGWTALHYAAERGHREVTELLLDNRARIDAVTLDGTTALHYAAKYGYENVVKLLLDRGANIAAVTGNGDTAFSWAARNGHREVVALLIGRGAKVDAVTLGGWTALHWAARNGHREVVELLLHRGAQMGAVNRFGQGALYCAAESGHREVVELLVGSMMVRPSDEQVACARDQIRKILLWEKKGRKVLHTRVPKDVLNYMFLLDELLCRNLAIILLRKVDRGLKIDACFTSKKVLLCAAEIILHGNGVLLENAYSKLPNIAALKSLFRPLESERNFSGCIVKALAEKVQQINKKCAARESIS